MDGCVYSAVQNQCTFFSFPFFSFLLLLLLLLFFFSPPFYVKILVSIDSSSFEKKIDRQAQHRLVIHIMEDESKKGSKYTACFRHGAIGLAALIPSDADILPSR